MEELPASHLPTALLAVGVHTMLKLPQHDDGDGDGDGTASFHFEKGSIPAVMGPTAHRLSQRTVRNA